MRTLEQLCVAYFEAVTERRRIHKILAAQTCERLVPWDEAMLLGGELSVRPSTCLDELFYAPRGPDREFPRELEYLAKCCDPCKSKLGALSLRYEAGKKLGAAKRSMEAIGKKVKEAQS